ncbi:MAG: methylenetetrahydrofolate reductase [NAD(P)H] [Candidatus Marinimicrobia bacterium]|jgi:methylenetetrahydrofolate reductase (NADPH)|nr:methylenetetrahydrofolate reductase [NAD(P)H] [Candidatus Neomarinimicrobiota bacterium]MBT3496580.1 methylenetetrahydrofolate reductase [NAD(P)H] [Candidatus Neomarinimicrobiota bacterium]MBT3693001.1 methylenetetrahydrofolate reductase [NAD(P)H] [Candidatus Neomarinimicrobiota bacterium]MBT3731614.1 methylenetetrahydrofolate reductase [NAD(P)H] [Candidatus Neomarinimicrobiota bacterium]MBT4145176.1 methylenetetrahydrofolate reductase [NAD(P)H] [Candidatus Neomarinimicrobiota bacterium]
MKVIDYLEKANKTLFSYEILPLKRGGRIDEIFELVDLLAPYEPPFIDLTSRSAEVYYDEFDDGSLKRHIRRKRPGTIGLSAAIKNRYNIETVPHILCNGFTKEETEDALIELNYLGIDNVLAVRGDDLRKIPKQDKRPRNKYASDLVEQIQTLNRGEYLEELQEAYATNFCVGIAGYPEKHFESPNLDADIEYLKQKVDKGADYIVTQMFYDNQAYFTFVEKCRSAGIDIPIIPGLKILTRDFHLRTIPANFYVDVPEALAKQIKGQSKEDIVRAGRDWALAQCQELVEANVPCIHFYIMSSGKEVTEVVSQF